jgi:hypothetical protein
LYLPSSCFREGGFRVSESQENGHNSSRRALLTAALGGAAAIAAQAALPVAAQGHDADDVELEVVNPATATTGLDTSATVDVDAFSAAAGGTGAGVVATAADGPAVKAASDTVAAAYVTSGDPSTALGTDNPFTGLYSFKALETDSIATGVWGDSADTGLVGTGGNSGVLAFGGFWGVYGEASASGGVGVYAYAAENNKKALYVDGKVGFRRSGKATISAGHATKVVNLSGVTSNSLVFAVLRSNRSGRWVRAVIPASGKFTIHLNGTVTKSTYVVWWVIN